MRGDFACHPKLVGLNVSQGFWRAVKAHPEPKLERDQTHCVWCNKILRSGKSGTIGIRSHNLSDAHADAVLRFVKWDG